MRHRCKKFLVWRVKPLYSTPIFTPIETLKQQQLVRSDTEEVVYCSSEVGDLRLRVTFYSVPTGGENPQQTLIKKERCPRSAQSSHIVIWTQQQVGSTIQNTDPVFWTKPNQTDYYSLFIPSDGKAREVCK